MSNQAFILLAPESWKSVRSQNVSQTGSKGFIVYQNVIAGFNIRDWHRNPESLRVFRMCRRPVQRALYGTRMSNQALILLASESWKSASIQNVSRTGPKGFILYQNVKGFNVSGTGILEVFRMAPESWKSVSSQNVSVHSVLRPFQEYFSSYETGQSVGGQTGEPREKPPGTPASRTWLVSHVARAGLETTPGEMIE